MARELRGACQAARRESTGPKSIGPPPPPHLCEGFDHSFIRWHGENEEGCLDAAGGNASLSHVFF
jgi:hypothetical protein